MYYEITNFRLLGNYVVELVFDDGKSGVVDLKKYLLQNTIFEKLLDYSFFEKLYINNGVLTWPDDIDISPETIYCSVTGEPLPSWMEK